MVNINSPKLAKINTIDEPSTYPSAKWGRLAGLPVQAGRLACRGRIAAPANKRGAGRKIEMGPGMRPNLAWLLAR